MTIVIDAPPALLAERLAARDANGSDAIGGRDADYHAAVRARFLENAARDPQSIVIDGDGTQTDVHDRIMAALETLLVHNMTDPRSAPAWAEWRSAREGTRMHHGWILAGRSGLGKRAFAMEAARDLVGAEGDSDHPDILVLDHPPKDDKEARKKADGKPYERARNIKVDQIRAMQRTLTTRATMGENRVIIIDPADDMEPSASNALLKSLEEPPTGTTMILVAHRPSRLLPTIRSRCRMLRFAPARRCRHSCGNRRSIARNPGRPSRSRRARRWRIAGHGNGISRA